MKVAPNLGEGLGCELLDLAPLDQAPLADKAQRQGDVLGHGHPFDHPKVLVDEGNRLTFAKTARPMLVGFSVDQHPAFIGTVDAPKDLDKC